jgi:hypothetical protein
MAQKNQRNGLVVVNSRSENEIRLFIFIAVG